MPLALWFELDRLACQLDCLRRVAQGRHGTIGSQPGETPPMFEHWQFVNKLLMQRDTETERLPCVVLTAQCQVEIAPSLVDVC